MQAVGVGHKSNRGPQKHRKPVYKYENGPSKNVRPSRTLTGHVRKIQRHLQVYKSIMLVYKRTTEAHKGSTITLKVDVPKMEKASRSIQG